VKMPEDQVRVAHAASIEDAHAVADELVVSGETHKLGEIVFIETLFHTPSIITFDNVGADSYFVHLPVTGRLEVNYRGVDLTASREGAAVYEPNGGAARNRWAAGTRSLAAQLPRRAVERALMSLLGEPPKSAPRFDPTMRMADPRARTWVGLVARLNRDLAHDDGLISQPIVAKGLAESLAAGFLYASRHSYSEVLAAPVRPPRQKTVRLALELMESDPAMPWTVAALAEHCGVSARAVQHGFRQHVGCSPMTHLRRQRLRRAHDELRAADPYTCSVADIARKWGFQHLGRFAAAHEAEYGETPLRTLRR
jgi:AraC-like DNA-binding protein